MNKTRFLITGPTLPNDPLTCTTHPPLQPSGGTLTMARHRRRARRHDRATKVRLWKRVSVGRACFTRERQITATKYAPHSPRVRPLHLPSLPTDGPRFGQGQGRDRPTGRRRGGVLRRLERQLSCGVRGPLGAFCSRVLQGRSDSRRELGRGSGSGYTCLF